ncbi:unnamed protein product [Didymodactylos carnosus]|nr:unnamed protein product [Didymodactylos carnosus]CAF4395839.1 unnamed protein product [Didymodactylos carnosus]
MGFYQNDLSGNSTLSLNTWYHVAYVYDYSSFTQRVYVLGVADGSKTNASAYTGQNGSITIGKTQINTPSNYFNGLIDNLVVTTRAKSASEILSDATLVCYYSFDTSSGGITQDSGPNNMNITTVSNVVAVSGRIGQAALFNGASSYFQAAGFFQLGQSNYAFSITMFVNPTATNFAGGSLVHISATASGTSVWCIDAIGFTYAGQISVVLYNGNFPSVVGPFLPLSQWSHVGYTYSQANGLRLYINGILFGSSGTMAYVASGYNNYLTFGFNFNACGSGPISGGYYQGAIDEVYVNRRELSAAEVYSRANS